MSDSFSTEDMKSFTFEQLREDELALDRKASLIDSRTDIDNQQTVNMIWRILLLLRFFWQRFTVVLTMEWVLAAVGRPGDAAKEFRRSLALGGEQLELG